MLRKLWEGGLAGLAGSAAMHAYRLGWEFATEHRARDGIFGFDREADVNSARLVYGLIVEKDLSEQDAARAGLGLHYAYGAVLGALYATAGGKDGRPRNMPASALAVLLWLCADEIPISLTGVSNPFRKSAASHLSALAAHLLFAITVRNALRAFDSGGAS